MLPPSPSGLAAFAATYDRIANRTIAPRWSARLVAHASARVLDRRLIAGIDPAQSILLAARACRLTSTEHRETLAASIDRILASAGGPSHRLAVAPNRAAVESQARQLTEFADLLRGPRPLYARGIAMLGRLLSDGTGPAYVGRPQMLAQRLRETRAALLS